MPEPHPPRRSLESLKKEAKRWLAALRDGDPAARERLVIALRHPPTSPTLRDVQLALAREHGFAGWAELKRAAEAPREGDPRLLSRYEEAARALLDAYRTGTPEAMERHYRLTWHRRPWQGMRTYVQLDLGKRPAAPGEDVDITLDDARHLIAQEHGFEGWPALVAFCEAARPRSALAAKPVRVRGAGVFTASRAWDEVIAALAAHPEARLDAAGEMTDDALDAVTRVESITHLDLGGSQALTNEGVRHLARLPRLRHLDLRGSAITDRGLGVLRELRALESVVLAQTRITDAGAAHLAGCPVLRSVDLAWTRTGDGAIAALAGKEVLARFHSGHLLTDAGLALLHDLPVFARWHGGETEMGLTSYRATPNQLLLRGTFTDRGMEHLRGLDGLFGLNLDDGALALTAAAMEPLVSLPNLGWLAVDAKDDWMPAIAAMPRLRYLGAQDTVAGDDGFVALSRSQSIEYIWGRRCHNLRTRGFAALAEMPRLRGLSVSCLNVDDAGIAALPDFPALRELMPMDIPDAGYRHIGRCAGLESLVLMYCRDTTDAATAHITGLTRLKKYFNSYTTITDRTPKLLSGMDSLEEITFDTCHHLTNAGLARLARLPRLRRLSASGHGLTVEAEAAFPPGVTVRVNRPDDSTD
jgi:hypothetical protein